MRSWIWGLVVASAVLGAPEDREIESVKRNHPSIPEKDGLKLEVIARLGDVDVWVPAEDKMQWVSSVLSIEVAVRNVSNAPITVPTLAFDGRVHIPKWPGWGGGGLERIVLSIDPPKFGGKITAYPASRFAPVTLQPGECALILRHDEMTQDRMRVDKIKEAAVAFGVSKQFKDQNDWWTGHLETYADIQRFGAKATAPDSKTAQPARAP